MRKMGTFPGFCWVCVFFCSGWFVPLLRHQAALFFGAGGIKPSCENGSQNILIFQMHPKTPGFHMIEKYE